MEVNNDKFLRDFHLDIDWKRICIWVDPKLISKIILNDLVNRGFKNRYQLPFLYSIIDSMPNPYLIIVLHLYKRKEYPEDVPAYRFDISSYGIGPMENRFYVTSEKSIEELKLVLDKFI